MELLKKLYSINSKSGNEAQIKEFILDYISDIDVKIEYDAFGNMFITKGCADIYPGITAHLDEVHHPTDRTIIEGEDLIYAVDSQGERVGLGADDKNGVWIILNLLHELPLLKAILFIEEERNGELAGCRGSRACSLDKLNNINSLLAVDRKGGSEIVVVGKGDIPLCKRSFVPQYLIEKYGYECVSGGRTDVVALKERGLTIPCCNISCGYYNAHKTDEFTKISELKNSYAFVKEWITLLK